MDRKSYTVEHKTKREARDATITNLRKQLSWTISDLKRVMSEDDGRWHSFGLVTRSASTSAAPAPEPAAGANGAFPLQPVLLPDPVEETESNAA